MGAGCWPSSRPRSSFAGGRRIGNADAVADTFGCYAFEARRLSESLERILTAAVAVLTPPKEHSPEASEPEKTFDDGPPLPQRVRALAAMVAHGVDEQVVTLTFLDGIGGTLARRLRDAGITDIEELALADTEALPKVRGVSAARAARWIAEATARRSRHARLSQCGRRVRRRRPPVDPGTQPSTRIGSGVYWTSKSAGAVTDSR